VDAAFRLQERFVQLEDCAGSFHLREEPTDGVADVDAAALVATTFTASQGAFGIEIVAGYEQPNG